MLKSTALEYIYKHSIVSIKAKAYIRDAFYLMIQVDPNVLFFSQFHE